VWRFVARFSLQLPHSVVVAAAAAAESKFIVMFAFSRYTPTPLCFTHITVSFFLFTGSCTKRIRRYFGYSWGAFFLGIWREI